MSATRGAKHMRRWPPAEAIVATVLLLLLLAVTVANAWHLRRLAVRVADIDASLTVRPADVQAAVLHGFTTERELRDAALARLLATIRETCGPRSTKQVR